MNFHDFAQGLVIGFVIYLSCRLATAFAFWPQRRKKIVVQFVGGAEIRHPPDWRGTISYGVHGPESNPWLEYPPYSPAYGDAIEVAREDGTTYLTRYESDSFSQNERTKWRRQSTT